MMGRPSVWSAKLMEVTEPVSYTHLLESTGDRSITLYQMAFAVNRQGVVSDIA